MRRHTATAYSRHGVTLTLGLTLLLAGAIGLLRTAPAAAAPALVGDSKWAYPATYQGRHYVLFSQVQGSDLALELAASADGASWTVLDPLPGAGKAPNYPRLVVTPDGLHAAWADDAGDGGVYFATSGADPSDLAGWRVERIADRGKNVGLAATADGSLLVTWDDNASAWVRRRGPDAQWGEAANLDLPCGSPCLVTVGAQPGGRAAVAFVDSGRNVVFTRFDAAGGWRRLDGGTRLSTAQANHWPQLATGPDGSAHVVWSQASGPGGAWEIQYARCDAAGRCSSPERVSRNLNGSLDRWPTVSVGADGVPSVAWQGDDAGPKGVYQIYARTRGGDADPWPDYADPSAYCVSCAGGEDAENPRYAAGSAELAYTQRDAPGQPWGIRYASGGSAAPVTTPGAAPGDNGNAGDTGAPARVSAPAPSPGEAGGTNDPSGTNGDPTGGQVEACVPSPVGGDLCARASLPIPSPAQLAQAALQALVNLAWGPLIGALIRGFYSVVAGDAFGEASRQIAGLLLGTPDLLVASGGMENVQRLVDVCRDAALALCVALFAFTALQAMLGNVVAPAGLLGRLVAVLFAVGFYRDLVRWLLRGADALTQGVLAIGQDRTTDLFAALLTATEPFWMLLGLVGAVLVIVLGVVKILGLGFLLLTYVVGPVLLPLALHPRAAGFVEVWAEHFVKALLWPALWAIELRLFGALIGGLGLVSGASATATLRGNVVAGLATLATVWLLLVTPWGIHTKLTLRQTVGVVVRTVGAGALLAATGGSAATITAAAAHGLRSRRAAPTAEAHSEGQ